MEFEWDPRKAATNLRKHGVAFAEAVTVFDDVLSATVADPDHSVEEERFITVGISHRDRILLIAHTDRSGLIRIISARVLNRRERKDYETERQKHN